MATAKTMSATIKREIIHVDDFDARTLRRYLGCSGRFDIGALLETADIIAAKSAMEHLGSKSVVTRGVEMEIHKLLTTEGDLYLNAMVNTVGGTSMEVGLRLESLISGTYMPVASAMFTFVAIDEQGRKCPVPPLAIQGDAERAVYDAACKRREDRRMEQDALRALDTPYTRKDVGIYCLVGNETRNCERSRIIAKPIHINIHGKNFGGDLMHTAYNLAEGAAYGFFRKNPEFETVGLAGINGISFMSAVDIESCVIYTTRLLYASEHTLVVGVSLETENHHQNLKTNECLFAFVGMDKSNKIINAPELEPLDAIAKAQHTMGGLSCQQGKDRRGKILAVPYDDIYHVL